MTTNVVIDPVTRIEGHLRIQAAVTEKTDSLGATYYEVTEPGLSSSTMVRGIEQIMTGRDPRDTWAFAQRICGVCTVVHGLTSIRAVEQALNLRVPKNAELVRNMMIGSQYVHDHVMHFYHLHALDWVDVASALTADPAKTAALAVGANPNNKPWVGTTTTTPTAYFQKQIANLVDATRSKTQLGLFNSSYWGHPAYKLTPEQNLLLVTHYLEALAWAREVVKLHAIFGGRDPHPNLLVGGVPITLSVGTEGGTALNTNGFNIVKTAITKMKTFVDNVYLPDTLLLAGLNKGAPNYATLPKYTDWVDYGASGLTDASGNFLGGNFLCYGEFANVSKTVDESIVTSITNDNMLIPHGVILGLSKNATSAARTVFNVLKDTQSVTENVTHAWYTYSGTSENLHPSVGQTNLSYTGPAADTPDYQDKFFASDKYSWIKSPRWQANGTSQPKPMEVGPLAHILMMYARNKLPGDKTVVSLVNANWISPTTGLGLPLGKLNSTFGRIFSRTLETKIIADAMQGWYDALYANKSAPYSDPNAFKLLAAANTWTADKLGVGFTEAPRGALGHWVKIGKSSVAGDTQAKVKHYQCIVASQWNAGPRDGLGQAGPYETSLKGHKLADPDRPVEILRTIHSFDPCIGCAVHIVDSNGKPLVQVSLNHS